MERETAEGGDERVVVERVPKTVANQGEQSSACVMVLWSGSSMAVGDKEGDAALLNAVCRRNDVSFRLVHEELGYPVERLERCPMSQTVSVPEIVCANSFVRMAQCLEEEEVAANGELSVPKVSCYPCGWIARLKCDP